MIERAVAWAHHHDGDALVPLGSSHLVVSPVNPPELSIFLWGHYEPDVAQAIAAVLTPGMTAIDVGANSGVLTVLMLDAVGPGGRVVSIDPSPDASARTRRQVDANGATNAAVLQVALGAERATERMFMAQVGIGALPGVDREYTTDIAIDVTVTTLDEIAVEQNLDRVDLIKIDTDGGEIDVLSGSRRVIADYRPVIVLEANPSGLRRRGREPEELGRLLSDLGYAMWRPRMEARSRLCLGPRRPNGFEPCGAMATESNVVALDMDVARHRELASVLSAVSSSDRNGAPLVTMTPESPGLTSRPTATHPDVSVCVAVYRRRRPPNVATLAAQLELALAGLDAELRVVLNGISPVTAEVPSGASMIRLPVNRGVPAAWNRAAAEATGDVMCFCNDDVELGPGAVEMLHRVLMTYPEAGVVGPLGTRWDMSAPRHLEWVSTEDLAPGEVRPCDVVSGFLFATRRDVFERVGGFDEAYTPCGFEEVDYCAAVRLQLGLECYAVAGVPHRHEFGISAARPWRRIRFDGRSESLGSIHRRNKRHFAGKWGAVAQPPQSHEPRGDS